MAAVRVLLFGIFVLATAGVAFAQDEASIDPAEALPAAVELVSEETPAVAPAAAAPFDYVAATRAYLDTQTPEAKERSDSYFEGGYWLLLWSLLYGLGVAWVFLGTGLSSRMRSLAERVTKRRPLQTALYVFLYIPIATVLAFPLTVYTGFFREHKYELATQTFGPWFKEQMIGLAVSMILMALLLIPLYGILRRAPKTWWAWGSLLSVGFLIFMLLVAPVYIDPLFNTYESLDDAEVRDPILSMARASGIDAERVLEFDASRQTSRISANVSGFMGTMAIRLNDNLLNRCSLPEIKAVMGHEIGHYALNHMYELIPMMGLVLVGAFLFIHLAFDRVRARWGSSWGVRNIGDTAGLPLIVALMGIYFFVATPFMNTLIRVNEAEADIYGLHTSREPDGFAEVALKLGEYRKLEPGPLEEWIFFDHPSGRARIEMAMRWKAENLGE